jgi:prefoldin subunit 5
MTANCSAEPVLDLSRRLGPAPSFQEASASVEKALDELRAAEVSLERQLSALRRYMRTAAKPAADVPAQAATARAA